MNDPDDSNPPGSALRCDDVSLRLPDLLAGELAEADARAIAEHVKTCARCARERADLEALERLFERDATPASIDVAEARLTLRRALAREGGGATATAQWRASPTRLRVLRIWREVRVAAGFALLLALFVPLFPRLQREFAPTAANDVAVSIENRAQELVASVGAWLPQLPQWKLPTTPPESLRSWFGALHSDAH
jgi:anti-sigma factor RsiW